MKPIPIALTALTLSFGTAYANPPGSEAELYRELVGWHGAATAPHTSRATPTPASPRSWAATGRR